jgi:TolB protein
MRTRRLLLSVAALHGLFILACVKQPLEATTDAITVEGESIQRLTVLTNRVDKCVDPYISRTGTPLVFACHMNENWDLYLKQDVHSEALQQLGAHPADDGEPSLAPDGSQVVFSSNRSGNYDLFTMSTRGGTAVRQLTDGPEDDRCPDWSPDGRKVAFHRLSGFDGQPYIWIKELDTNALIQIGPGLCPRFSPDSQQLAYYRSTGGSPAWYSIWMMDLDGSNNIQLAGGSGWGAINVTWSPQGDYLMFVSDKGLSGRRVVRTETHEQGDTGQVTGVTTDTQSMSSKNLWIVKPDGASLSQLTQHPRDDYSPWWGNDGAVYFTSTRDRKTKIWSMVPVLNSAAQPTTWSTPSQQ